jgi:hypothetical protein
MGNPYEVMLLGFIAGLFRKGGAFEVVDVNVEDKTLTVNDPIGAATLRVRIEAIDDTRELEVH